MLVDDHRSRVDDHRSRVNAQGVGPRDGLAAVLGASARVVATSGIG